MPKSYWTRIQTPNGLKYFRADEVTDELMQKIRDAADDVFYVEYGVTTFVNALAAYNAGKTVLLLKTSGTLTHIYTLVSASSTTLRFSKVDGQLQDIVSLNSSNQYSDTHTTLAKSDNVMKTVSAEIAPEYYDLCIEYQTEHKFPIPAGTIVTYLDNTSSDVLQYLYKSKVEIYENDYASSDPIAAPEKWDKINVSYELSKNVVYIDILQTPFSKILALYNQGQNIVARYGYEFYRLTSYIESYGAITTFGFQNISSPVVMTWYVTSDGPSETNNWLTPPSIYFNSPIYNIATPYSETSTYSVGDIVSRDSNIYRCITDISVAETWTDAHWTQTTVAEELNKLKNEQPVLTYSFSDDNYPSGNDIWNDVSNGKMVILKRSIMYTRYVYIISSFGSHGNQRDVYFTCLSTYTRLNLHTSNSGTSWSWTEGDTNRIAVFTGRYSQLDPNDVSGLPDAQSVRNAVDSGKIVVLHLKTPLSQVPAVHYFYWLDRNETYVLHFVDLHRRSDEEHYLDLRTSDNAWLVNTYAPQMPARLFVETPVLGGAMIPNGNSSFNLGNVVDGFSLALIGLTASDGSYVSAGDIFELVMNGCPAFGNSNLSMGLFKMVGHPTAGTSMSGPVTFRRLTASLPPRSITGVRNDGGVPPYGQEPVAANPVRFTLDQSAQFEKGELLYLGIAVAYDSTQQPSAPIFICAGTQLPVHDYNDPMSVVGPVYYATGTSDKIGADGFTAREFTIGYSDADFSYASTFASGLNAYKISSGGVAEIQTKTYPSGFKLMKQ